MKIYKIIVPIIFLLFSLPAFAQQCVMTTPTKGPTDPTVITIPFVPLFDPLDPDLDPLFEEDRIVFWIHGLGGNTDSWTKTANNTHTNFKVTSLRPTYSEYTLEDAGQDLHNILVSDGDPHIAANGIEDPNINFLVAHSQGGLVSKATDKYYKDLGVAYDDRRFGGIVTFGTPHQGAKIINSIDLIKDFIGESCNALIAGPYVEAFQGNWLLDVLTNIGDPFTSPGLVEEGLSTLCGFLGSDLLPLVVFSGQLTPITEDYAVGSPILEELNNYGATIPRVAFYGVEEEPVMWRTLKYFSTENAPNNFDNFGANYDDDAVETANENLLSYEAKMNAYHDLHNAMQWDGCAWWKPWNDDCFSDTLLELTFILDSLGNVGFDAWEAYAVYDAYLEGFNWWVDANDNYKMFIGALEVEMAPAGYECTCIQYNQHDEPISSSTSIVQHPDECEASNALEECEYITLYDVLLTEKESDGVVLAESAGGYPGARTDIMFGSNHQQMVNDENTEIKRDRLMDGGYSIYFKTLPR